MKQGDLLQFKRNLYSHWAVVVGMYTFFFQILQHYDNYIVHKPLQHFDV